MVLTGFVVTLDGIKDEPVDQLPNEVSAHAAQNHAPQPGRLPTRVIAGVGILTVVIAVMVLIGWLTHNILLTSITPAFPAMQINTALAFFACGIALVGFSRRRAAVVRTFAAIVGLIGIATVIEHVLDVDLGIDRLFGEPFFSQGTMRPGRMAPVSAVCFSLLGTALLAMARSPLMGWRAIHVSLVGALISTLGVLSIAGLPLGLGETYGWGNLIRLAPLTAFCFFLVGTSLATAVLLRHYHGRLPLAEIRGSIIGYSVIGTGMVALVSTALVAVPLYVTLQKDECTALLRATEARAVLCAAYRQHLQDLARQISATVADERLHAIIENSDEIAGITRRRSGGKTTVTVGLVLPPEYLERVTASALSVSDLLVIDDAVVVAVTAPLSAPDGLQLELDVVLVRSHALVRALARQTHDDASQEVRLVVPDAQGNRWFKPADRIDGLQRVASAGVALSAGDLPQVGSRLLRGNTANPVLEACARIPGSSWHLLVSINAGAAFGSINQHLLVVLAMVSALMALGSLAVFALVRPLTASLLMHADELQAQVAARTARLNTELHERQRITQALAVSEERFRLLSTAAPVGIFQTDIQGRCLYTNPHWQQLAGLTLDQTLGYGWATALHPDDRQQVFADWEASLAAQRDFSGEFRFQTSTGAVRWINSHATAVLAADRSIIGYVGTVQDITDSKLARDELAQSEACFRSVVSSANAAILRSDARGVVCSWNPAAQRIFGYNEAEIIGQSLTLLIPERLREAHRLGLQRVIQGGETRVVGTTVELLGLHRDGREFPIELSLSMWRTSEGLYFSGIIQDITARTREQAELRAAKEGAEAAAHAKSDFLATMSHEIRTPMNGVIGMAGLLLDTPLSEAQRSMVDTVRGSAESLLTIINDILDFSKIEAGKMTLEALDFSLREVVEEAVALLKQRALDRGMTLNATIGAEVPEVVIGDPGRLRQVLVNLIANAVKFTERGSVTVIVTCAEELVSFAVRDTGIGIAVDDQGRLFSAFTQADSSMTRRFGGTGLGLAICKRLVELMGGTIGLSSTPGVGSTFYFTVHLPARPVSAKKAAPVPQAIPKLRGRVLVAEDNPVNQRVTSAQLTRLGLTADVVANGVEALDALARLPYDAVLMDCQMPEMDGFQATRALRVREALRGDGRHLPVIAMTANAMSGDREECLAAGMDDYVAKPVRVDLLVAVLARWLPAN